MKILVTGAAGFIGFYVAKRLAVSGHDVIGLDNINDYYSTSLKFDRLKELGINPVEAEGFNELCASSTFKNLKFVRMALEDGDGLRQLFNSQHFDVVCNLAAQAGVRYSLEHPETYIQSNIVGFLNILECCRHTGVKHLVYASSSSVYGENEKVPFETSDRVDHPISLYAATKKSNELMAFTYNHLYGFATTGLRFFTVYGPWGRPDMAMFLFTDAIVNGRKIKVFNNGNLERDFTYVDDIVEGVIRIIEDQKRIESGNNADDRVYNIGNSNSVKLMDFITQIEEELGVEAKKEFLPMQPGDVPKTWANVDDLIRDYQYRPKTTVQTGVHNFITWFKEYYNV